MNIYVARELWADKFSVYLRKWGTGNTVNYRSVALPVKYRNLEAKDEGMVFESAFQMTQEEAQEMIDSLWACGVRPSEGSGSAGSLAATERHLADMRHLVFKTKP